MPIKRKLYFRNKRKDEYKDMDSLEERSKEFQDKIDNLLYGGKKENEYCNWQIYERCR